MAITRDIRYWCEGTPSQKDRWAVLYWLSDYDTALRQSVEDKKWYLTTGYVENTIVTHGPFDTVAQVQMLIQMGVIDEYKT